MNTLTATPLKPENDLSVRDLIARIRANLEDIRKCIELIANDFIRLKQVHGTSAKTVEFLSGEFPGVDCAFWRNIDLVASGELHSVVLSSGCVGVKELRKLPLKAQEEAVTIGIPVQVKGDDYRLIPAHLLTARDIKRAITSTGGVRTLAEQRKFDIDEIEKDNIHRAKYEASIKTIQSETDDNEGESNQIKFTVRGDKVHIFQCPLTLTVKDIQQILRSFKK